jgi:hypothetical protein
MQINTGILLDKLANQGIPTGNAKVLYGWVVNQNEGYVYNNLVDAVGHYNASGLDASVKPGINVGNYDNAVSSPPSTTDYGHFNEEDVLSIGSKVEYDNWTAFINFEEFTCGNKDEKTRSRVLLSSMNDPNALSGFMLGVNGANKLFYEYVDTSGVRQVQTLNRVLGEKNLISISNSKDTNAMTLGFYDPVKNQGQYASFNTQEKNNNNSWYLGGTLSGISWNNSAFESDNFLGFKGDINNFLILSGYYNEIYLKGVSDVFFLTGYSPAQTITSSSSYDTITGYTETQGVAGQGITGYELQQVTVGNSTVFEEVPLYGNIYENQLEYLTDPSITGSIQSAQIQAEIKNFDYGYIKGYAKPCLLWDSSFDTADSYEIYTCDVYSNKINLRSKRKGGGLFPIDTGLYTAGENINIYVNGEIQESGVDYGITSDLKISGMASGYLADDKIVYDIVSGTQYWWNFTGWQGTMVLGDGHDQDVFLNKKKLVSGVDYTVVDPPNSPGTEVEDVEVYATNLQTGRMALIPRHQGITQTLNAAIGDHGKCFASELISEQIWVEGLRNAEGPDYAVKTKCDISCKDPDGTLSEFVAAKNNKIFSVDGNILITGTNVIAATTPQPIVVTTPSVTTTTGAPVTTTTTSPPTNQTYYYGLDCNTVDSAVPTIVLFSDAASVLNLPYPDVVKLTNLVCVSNVQEETSEISSSLLEETNGEIFNNQDYPLLPDTNTACIECLGNLPTTTTTSTTTTAPPPSCEYIINASLNWDSGQTNRADLDVYVKTLNGCDNQSAVVYWGSVNHTIDQNNHMSLDQDAHPICAITPPPPETITGTFTDNREFQVWWNQHSICASQVTAPIRQLSVENTGDLVFQVNGVSVSPGTTYWIVNSEDSNVTGVLAYAGFANGDQSTYQNGTAVTITGCTSCGG